jgi:hypothetical protein
VFGRHERGGFVIAANPAAPAADSSSSVVKAQRASGVTASCTVESLKYAVPEIE